jgi:hypothetical protein
MKKFNTNALLLTASMLISAGVSAEGSMQHFGGSAQNLKQSTTHTAGSIGNGVVGSAKLVSGVAAVPFKVLGSVAAASNAVGNSLWDNATGSDELEVSDTTVTAGPAPMMAMNN